MMDHRGVEGQTFILRDGLSILIIDCGGCSSFARRERT
jgi:hypothetical protein